MQVARRAGRGRLGSALRYAVLVVFALFFTLPLLWMLVTALKPPAEWLLPNWVPQNPTLGNFTAILNNPALPVFRWFLNSALLAAVATAATVALDAMAAYAYARLRFPGRNVLFGVLLSTLVMPGIIFLVPNYLTVAALGGLNTYWLSLIHI